MNSAAPSSSAFGKQSATYSFPANDSSAPKNPPELVVSDTASGKATQQPPVEVDKVADANLNKNKIHTSR